LAAAPQAATQIAMMEHPLLNLAADFIHLFDIEGDYLEFGVFEGRSFAAAYRAISERQRRFLGPQRRFWAFDSFQGLPEPEGADVMKGKFLLWDQFFLGRGATATTDFLSRGQFACSRNQFVANIQAEGVPLGAVEIVEGFFERSLVPELKQRLNAAAIIHVDVDYYASAVSVLNFVADLIQDGTILIFDDYFCYRGHPNRGERRAFAEFLAAHPEFGATDWQHWGPTAVAFIVNRI
jgi:O-methyltransferase